MNYGKLNVVVGFTGLTLAVLGGISLGFTFDQYSVKDGNHVLSLVRFYLREGHSHGMPLSLYNLIIALWVDKLNLSNGLKKTGSILAALALVLPIGLAAKGAAGAASDFPPFGMIGVLGMLGSVVIFLIGAIRTQKNS
ncbi:hypothetical protein K1X84_15240 [bacterium]|nr:hypothetical protein [bacterium]